MSLDRKTLARSLAVATLVGTAAVLVSVAAPSTAFAVGTCGGQKDTCKCGGNNPYPCCGNGSNCTWWSWHSACCTWKQALPGWGNANTWAKYASQNPNFKVLSYPVVGSIASSNTGKYGHVAWVTAVGNGTVTVSEMNCCGTCHWGKRNKVHSTAYFNSGFIVRKSYQPPPKCGNGKCESGESCAKCPKDCGACCGNGKCDNGETCGSCNKDCKCLPTGGLDAVTCSSVQGWARDPDDTGAKLQVSLRVAGKEVAKTKASLKHSKHGSQGFSWKVPSTLHDSAVHSVSAVAIDSQGKGTKTLGTRPLQCQNHTSDDGIWRSTHAVFSGASVQRPAGPVARLALRHDHPKAAAANAIALSGELRTCTEPGVQPFDELAVDAQWDLGAGKLRSALLLDEEVVRAWDKGSGSETLALKTAANRVCLRTTAPAQVVETAARHTTLASIAARRGGWWYSYSADVSGLIVDFDERERIGVRARVDGAAKTVSARGRLRCWRALPAPFNEISVQAKGLMAGAVVELLADRDGDAASAVSLADSGSANASKVGVSPRSELAVQVRLPEAIELGAEDVVQLRGLRIGQRAQSDLGPWHVVQFGSWGLAVAPAVAVDPDGLGRAVVLQQTDMRWWRTGAVHAELRPIEGEFERVRGRLLGQFSGPAPLLTLRSGPGAVALSQDQVGFDVALRGSELAVEMAQHDEVAPAALTTGHRTLMDLAFFREGWWTARSPLATRVRSRRWDDGVGLETVPTAADSPTSLAVRGHVALERELPTTFDAVRLRYRQALDPNAVRVLVTLDGVPMALLSEHGVDDHKVEVSGATFSRFAFVLSAIKAPNSAAGGTGARQWARFSDVELRAGDGKWTPLSAIAQPAESRFAHKVDVSAGQAGGSGGDGGAGGAGGSGGEGGAGGAAGVQGADAAGGRRPTNDTAGAQSSGCSTHGRSAPPGHPLGLFLLSVAAVWGLRWRRLRELGDAQR